MKDQCVICLGAGGDARNGGLCHKCCPPLRIVLAGFRVYRRRR